MTTETESPASESLKDLARRAAGIAQNSKLEAINLHAIDAKMMDFGATDEPKLELANEHRVEFFHTPEVEDEGGRLLVRLYFDVKVRDESSKQALFQLSAAFNALYLLNHGMPDEVRDDMDAFAETNAVIHAWPYFRELVQSTLWRFGLPPFALPLFRITDEKPASMLSSAPPAS